MERVNENVKILERVIVDLSQDHGPAGRDHVMWAVERGVLAIRLMDRIEAIDDRVAEGKWSVERGLEELAVVLDEWR